MRINPQVDTGEGRRYAQRSLHPGREGRFFQGRKYHPLFMKNLFSFVLLTTLVASPVVAQSSVWKIQSGDNIVYLGGTCHLLRADNFPLPTEFDAAFAAAETIFLETDLARMQTVEAQQLLLARGRYGDNASLKSAVNDEAWLAVEQYCERTDISLTQLNQFRPWLVAVTVTVIELQKLGFVQEGVDFHYHQRATEAGKTLEGLEPFEEHIGFITNMGAGHESEMLISTLNDLDQIPQMFDGVITAWKSGDLKTLDSLILRDMKTEFPSVYQELIVKRNLAWLPRIEEMLQSTPTELVLVGVGHLAGSEGLIAQLERRGFLLEQLVGPLQ